MLSDLSGGDLIIFLVSLLVSLTVHEAMHGYVAHWLGDDTAHQAGRLTLNPLAHINLFTMILLPLVMVLAHQPPILAAQPVPFNPYRLKWDEFGAALVGLAGPLTNLALAGAAAAFYRLWGPELSSSINNAIVIFTSVNIGFFVFNMIPLPPLDGSRLLYAFAPEWLQDFMRQIEAAGFITILVILVLIVNFGSNPIINIQQSILDFLLL